jgi:hypothetical protein
MWWWCRVADLAEWVQFTVAHWLWMRAVEGMGDAVDYGDERPEDAGEDGAF